MDEQTEDQAANEPTAVEVPPTHDEARAMFAENPGLAAVLTTAGFLHRDGRLTDS